MKIFLGGGGWGFKKGFVEKIPFPAPPNRGKVGDGWSAAYPP